MRTRSPTLRPAWPAPALRLIVARFGRSGILRNLPEQFVWTIWEAGNSSSAYEPLSSAASYGFDPWVAWARGPGEGVEALCRAPCPAVVRLGLEPAPLRPTSRIPWPSPAGRWLSTRPRFARRLRSAPRVVRAPPLSASPKIHFLTGRWVRRLDAPSASRYQ